MAGSINLANVAIGFDASKITKGVDLSAGEMRKLNGIIKESISPMDRYNADLAVLEKAHKAGAVSADRMKQAVASLQDKYKQGVSASGTNSMTSDLKSTLAQYAGMAAAFQGLKKSLSLAATAETNKIALEVLTGSTAKAQMLYEGFIELDRSSPLSRADFSRSAQTLIGYGYAAESTLPALKALSEVSVGNADRFQSLSLAFGQVTASGRLMGQETLQMVNAGFNPLQEISRTTGRSMVELKKAMEEGAISASMVEDAFKSATSEGGRFYEMNEKLKNSAAGQFAKMSSDVEMMATEIGTNLMPAMKALMDLMNSGADATGKGGALAKFAETFSVGLEGIIAIGSDAFTNLDANSQGTKFAELQERLGGDKLKAQMEKDAGIHVQTKEERERIAKIMADRQAKEREELEAIAAKEKKAADEKAAASKLESDKQKKAQQEAEQAFKKLNEEAEKLKKATASPFEKYVEQFTKLQELFNEGLIDEETFNRGNAEALSRNAPKAEKEKNNNPNNIVETIAPALRAGSAEAYKFLLQQKEDAAQIAKEQVDVAKEGVDIQKQQLEAIKQTQQVGRARR